jgi:hypothetical protein
MKFSRELIARLLAEITPQRFLANLAGAGDATKFLDGSGALSTPAAGGGGGDAGLVRLTTSITLPAASVALAVPEGYDEFWLSIPHLRFSDADGLSIAVSLDGGETYKNDASNFDTYITSYNSESASSLIGVDQIDALITIGGSIHPSSGPGGRCFLHIYPGSDTAGFTIEGVAANPAFGGLARTFRSLYAGFNPNATTPSSLGRITHLLLLPYGSGAVPPTSGETITEMILALWGVS